MKYILFSATALLATILPPVLKAQEVPAGKIVYSYTGLVNAAQDNVAWFYSSEEPLKRRDLAQTFKATADGTITTLALPIAEGSQAKAIAGMSSYHLVLHQYSNKPETRPTLGSVIVDQTGTATLEGTFLIFTFDEPVQLIADNYYTYLLEWTEPGEDARISFYQVDGNEEANRWHRESRGRWVASPKSLKFFALDRSH